MDCFHVKQQPLRVKLVKAAVLRGLGTGTPKDRDLRDKVNNQDVSECDG
jgi:hypothetical protein